MYEVSLHLLLHKGLLLQRDSSLTDLTTKAQRSQKVSKTSWSLCLCGELSRRSLVVVLGVLPPLIVRVNLPRTDVARRTTSDTREELLRQRLCVSEFAF